jgi:hypothetical protein
VFVCLSSHNRSGSWATSFQDLLTKQVMQSELEAADLVPVPPQTPGVLLHAAPFIPHDRQTDRQTDRQKLGAHHSIYPLECCARRSA